MDSVFNLFFFLIGAIAIWISGTKLAIYADEIGERTKVSKAFIGAFLLAFTTSLPEVITTITASALDNPKLAVNNLIGGVPLQTCMLAIVDLFFVRGSSLSYLTPTVSLVLTGVFLIIQLGFIVFAYSFGEITSIFGVGIWPITFFIFYIVMLKALHSHQNAEKWIPVDLPSREVAKKLPFQKNITKLPNLALGIYFFIACSIVLVAGWDVAYFADTLSTQVGISSSFVGATFVALATSLPELSTTYGAIKIKAYTMAFANIFGSNTLMMAVFLIADIAYRKGSIVASLDKPSLLMAASGIIVTCIYLWGILARQKKKIFMMGFDSLLVLVVYILSLIALTMISQ